jgi:Flp pilus assembly protein TadG
MAVAMPPILMLVTFSIVDFGLLFYTRLSLESAVSQAVRYGITGGASRGCRGRSR